MKSTIWLMALLVFSIENTGFADELRPSDDWFQCNSDKDCIEINYECSGGTVNKAFARKANEFYGQENARMNCVTPTPTEAQKKIPYRVFCEKKKCKVQGINPKGPGFS